ncbi:MAG: AAA family ATPase [Bacteroidales bacterium]|nr:AAA family ATPase [Bacteroidales bacterium]
MKLKMTINKIKSIDHLEIELPIENGLYAITGQNGSGKSTVVTCASSVFFNMRMNDYFGLTADDASIEFSLNNSTRGWRKLPDGRWWKESTGSMNIKGFYEGSIIFGNRFRNTTYELLKRLDRIDDRVLKPAAEFIRENLGKILHNNPNFYDKLFKLNNIDAGREVRFSGNIFYYQKRDRRVSQFHMSTGENLLISVLNSINIRNSDRANLNKPCLLFLDEIELALHPSSLKRLVAFLKQMSVQYNYAIYFSTHSIELISAINPDNIFFLERHSDNTVEILNPCYPAYATRILYDHAGYDYIILVEDDLAKEIVSRLLRKHSLLANKLVHVLPCGGYTNVIDLSKEVVNSNLVGKTSNISIILDGDVKTDAQNYISKNGIYNNIPVNYLPIESLEKFLKTNLHDNVDHKYFRLLNDFIFHQVSLSQIIEDYKNQTDVTKDKNGKRLYKRIDTELRERGKSRADIIEMTVDYLLENHTANTQEIVTFLKELF